MLLDFNLATAINELTTHREYGTFKMDVVSDYLIQPTYFQQRMCMRTGTGDTVVSDSNEHVAELQREHASLDKRLDELNQNVYLTATEKIEVAKIKRQKLAKKDQIHRISLANQS